FVHNLLHLTGPAAPQPFLEADRGAALVFNGEVYNHALLAAELGLRASGASDGAVLLPAYRCFGPSFVRRLDGEFALALVDFREKTVLLATDASGTKPLWWARAGGTWAAASYQSALSHLGLGEASLLEPNTVMVCSLDGLADCKRFASYHFDMHQLALPSADKPMSQGADGGSAASKSEAESVPKEPSGLGQEGGREPEEFLGMRPESCNHGRSQGDDQLQAKPERGKLLATCARGSTVVVTSASAFYGQALLRLARSAAVQGFHCTVACIQEDFQEAFHAHVLPVRLSAELLPEPQFCGESSVEVMGTVKLRQRWGWRRTQLYKVMAYRSVLKQGFDVLLMDTDWYFIADPLPFFHILSNASAGHSMDVVGKKDNYYKHFGLSWTRSSAATVAMAESLEKRIGDGWDQYLWSHEMQTMDISCCHVHSSLYLRFFQMDREVHHQWVHEPADADSKKRCKPGNFDAKGWINSTRLPSLCSRTPCNSQMQQARYLQARTLIEAKKRIAELQS
ncbi:unnamed protein product, partial [Polarella glacialis]